MFPAIKSSTVQHGAPFPPLCAAACKQRIEDSALTRQHLTALGPPPRAYLGARPFTAPIGTGASSPIARLTITAGVRERSPHYGRRRSGVAEPHRQAIGSYQLIAVLSALCRYRDIPYQFRIAGPLPRVTRRSGGSKPSAPSIVPFSQSARVPQVNWVLRPFRPAFTL